jgi:SAM-dependent methyltransferase
MNSYWPAICAYLTLGTAWNGPGPGDPWLRRLLGVTSVHTRLRSLHILKALSEVQPFPGSVLELGFGEGYLLLWLARRHPGAQFTGWELDESLVVKARTRARHLGLANLTLHAGDFAAGRDRPRFDLIYCADVLEHVPEDEPLLGVLAQCLHPGARLIIHVPKRRSLQRRFLSRFQRHFEPGHVREEYTAVELACKVAAAGLEIVKMEETFGPAGELAFELNSLGWPHPTADRVIRALTLPLVLPLGLLDLKPFRSRGNSLLLTAQK